MTDLEKNRASRENKILDHTIIILLVLLVISTTFFMLKPIHSPTGLVPGNNKIKINEKVEDAEYTALNTTLEITKQGNLIYNDTEEEHDIEIEIGEYDILIKPIEEISVRKVQIKKEIKKDIDQIIDIDEIPEIGTEYSQTYAVEPRIEKDFDLSITVNATGTELYQCEDWDFENRECEGEWVKILDTIPGETYTVDVDCGFKEKGGCKCKGVRYITLESNYSFVNGSSYSVTAEAFKGSSTNPNQLIDSETINFSLLPQGPVDNNPGNWRGNLIIEKINQSSIVIKFHNKSMRRLLGDNTFRITINSSTLGPETIHLSCSQPINIRDVFGDFEIIDIDKILSGSDCSLPILNLVSPANNSIISTNNVSFEYNVYDQNQSISFCELIINRTINQTDYSITEGVSQFFNITLANGTYEWSINCTTSNYYEAASETREFQITTINDTTPPVVNLISPANNSIDNDGYVIFKYNTTDNESNIAYCELIVNDSVVDTDNSITEGVTQSFSKNLANGTYTWSINCTNSLNLTGTSETRILIVNITIAPISNASCCCGLTVSTTPEVVTQGEKILITADVSNLLTGLAATPSDVSSINATIYRIDNGTEIIVINNTPMTYLDDGLWYYEFYVGNNSFGTYIASAEMITNQTTPFVKEASDSFTVGEKISGLTIIGISPDLININQTVRLAAEIKYNGIAVDDSLILNASLVIQKINGTTQTYTTNNSLQVDDGIIYVDGAFNETGIYYLDWKAAYLGQTRTAREIVVIVGWEELLQDINYTVNVELVTLIKENRQYLLELLTDMEYMQEFTEEEIFLITDSVNSMTKVINYLEKGEMTNEEAEKQFNKIREELVNKLGDKLTGSLIGTKLGSIEETQSPLRKVTAALKDWRIILFIVLLFMFAMIMVILLLLVRILQTGILNRNQPVKQIKQQIPETTVKPGKRRYEILIDKIKKKIEDRKKEKEKKKKSCEINLDRKFYK